MEKQGNGNIQDQVNIASTLSPILEPRFSSIPSGKTLREIVQEQKDINPDYARVFVDGGEEANLEFVPKNGQYVSICQVQEATGAAIAAWAIGAAIVTGIVVGIIIYNMMEQPDAMGGSEKLQRITGAKNEAKPYEIMPVILGDRRVVPSYAAQPYTYWKGDEQYLKMLLCVGHGPLGITDIKIGDNPIWNYRNTSYEVLDWLNTHDTRGIKRIWNSNVQQDQVGQELVDDNYVNRAAPKGTEKITADYFAPSGLWRTNDGDMDKSGNSVVLRYKVGGVWYSLAKVHVTTGGVVSGSLVKDNNRYYRMEDGSNNLASSAYNNRRDLTDRVVLEKDGYAWVKDVNSSFYKLNTTVMWEATRDQFSRTFEFEPIDPLTGKVPNEEIPLEFSRNNWSYGTGGAGFSTTLQLTSLTYTLDNTIDDSYFGIDEPNNTYPVLIALDIKATEQLSGVIDNLSCRARSQTPSRSNLRSDWKGLDIRTTQWYNSYSPAKLYKWFLQGYHNRAAVSNDRIDNDALVSWENTCRSKGWKTAEIINYEATLQSTLNNIAFTGRAFSSMPQGKFSVIENNDKNFPAQVFTPKNTSGFTSKRDFPLATDGIKYTFANADFEDQEDEGYYGDPDKFHGGDIHSPKSGVQVSKKYETLDIWGTTSPVLAATHARFAFFENKLRREVYQFNTDIEGLIARRGDKVLVSSDVIDVGYGQGFIKEVEAGRFRVDETLNLEAGQAYTTTIRYISNGVKINSGQFTYAGDGWWDGSLPSGVTRGDLISYGKGGEETLECLVTEVTYSDDFNATLTLVNYAEELYDVDNGALPDYESGLSGPRERDITPLAPNVTVNTGEFTYESNSISVVVSKKMDDPARVSAFKLEYRYNAASDTGEVDAEEVWNSGGVSEASSGRFEIPISNIQGISIDVRAQAINEAGIYSPYSGIKSVDLLTDPVPDVEWMKITEKVDLPKTPDARWSTITVEVLPPAITAGYVHAILEYRQPGQEEYNYVSKLGWKDENKASVEVFADGRRYEFRVRSVSTFGVENKNGISKILTTTNTEDPEYTEDNPFEELPAPNVRGLELTGQGNDTEFTGKDAKFSWRKSSAGEWVDIGYEGLRGAGASKLDQYFRDYEVEVWAGNELVRTEHVVDSAYTYSYEKNAEDFQRMEGRAGAYREMALGVIMRTRQNQRSPKQARLNVSNPAPKPLTGLKVAQGFKVLTVNYNKPKDLDFEGVEVWVGKESGFDINDDVLAYDGPDTEVNLSGLETGTTYYITLRPYDSFGKSVVFSTELIEKTLRIASDDLDETPPNRVRGVELSTAVSDERLQSVSYIDVTWNPVVNTKIANYTIEINGEELHTVAGESYRFSGAIPGDVYSFRVRANSFATIEGKWSAVVSITAAISAVAPTGVTNASARGGLDKCVVEWNNPESENFYTVNVYRGLYSSFTPSPSNRIASVGGARGSSQRSIDADVTNGPNYYYKLVSETLGGVKGTVVNAGMATPNKITDINVDEYFESAAIGDAYIGSLDAAKINTGTLDADRIGANSIHAGKMDVTQLEAISADMGTLTAGTIKIGTTSSRAEISTIGGIRAWSNGTQTLHFKPDGTGYIGASQDISWDGSGNVNISGELGAGSVFTDGVIEAKNGNVSTTVGAKTIDGDAYLLSVLQGTDLKFGVDELGNVSVKGAITIEAGSSGLGSFSDAGALATKDEVDYTDDVSGTKPPADATKGADWNSTLDGIPNRIKDTATVGLNLTESYLGYYDGTDFLSYIADDGKFHFGDKATDPNANYIDYNGSKLVIETDNFSVDASGNASFSGDISGSNGTFSGELSGATGLFGDESGEYIKFDGTNLTIDTPSMSLDSAGSLSLSGSIIGSDISGSTIRTAMTGRRVIIDSTLNNIELYDQSDKLVFSTGETVAIDQNPFTPSLYSISDGVGAYVEGGTAAIFAELTPGNAEGSAIEARGNNGKYGVSASGRLAGVYARSQYGDGVYGDSFNGAGVYGISDNGAGVKGFTVAGPHDFYAAGTGSYGSFTGAHDAFILKTLTVSSGDILSVTGKVERSGVSHTAHYLEHTGVNSKAVYGVYTNSFSMDGEMESSVASLKGIGDSRLASIAKDFFLVTVNALGEGQINVCSENGDFEVGDFICTSNTPGKGMRYDGQDLRYVVAKCMEPIIWSEEDSNIKMVACIYMCG